MCALCAAVTRIRTWVASATTKSTNHYAITAIGTAPISVERYRQRIVSIAGKFEHR